MITDVSPTARLTRGGHAFYSMGMHPRPPLLTLAATILASLFLLPIGCGQSSDPTKDPTVPSATIRGIVTTTPNPANSGTEASLTTVPGAFCFLIGVDRFDTTDRTGAFLITDVPAGSYLFSCEKSDAEGRPYALLTAVEATAGQVTDLGPITITQTGRVQGTARLAGQTDHTGITVSLPPLTIETTTDAAGGFEINGIAAADYTIRFERSGYRTAETHILVGSQQTTVVSGVILQPE